MYKITITNTRNNETKSLTTTDEFRTFEDTFSFSKSYSYAETIVNDFVFSYDSQQFTPMTIEFSALAEEFGDLTEFRNFIRMINQTFIMTIESDREQFEEPMIFNVMVRLESDTIKPVASTQNDIYSLTFKTLTHFMVLDEYKFGATDNTGDDRPGFTYSMSVSLGPSNTNPLESLRVPINVRGDRNAYLNVEIDGPSTNPGFGVDKSAANTTQSYQSKDLVISSEEKLNIISHPGYARMVVDDSNVEQEQEFVGHDGYVSLEPWKTDRTLIFNGTLGGRVIVISQFSNIL